MAPPSVTPPSSPPTKCTMCSASHIKLCASCRAISYCSVECQKKDWSLHRSVCSAFTKNDKPSPTHKRGFLFPIDSVSPKLVWIKFTIDGDIDERFPDIYPDFEDIFGGAHAEYLQIPYTEASHFTSSRSVELVVRQSHLIDGSKLNASAMHTTKGTMCHAWNGPILVLSKNKPTDEQESNLYTDVIPADLRVALDYMMNYEKDPSCEPPANSSGSKGTVRGVKINCRGDQSKLGVGLFTVVEVSVDDLMLRVVGKSFPMIPTLLGLGLTIWKCVPEIRFSLDPTHDFSNTVATALNMGVDPKNIRDNVRGNGLLSEWQGKVGNVVVVRKDFKPITPKQIEALYQYCRFLLDPSHVLVQSSLTTDPEATPTLGFVFQTFVSKRSFRGFFEKYQEKKVKEGFAGWAEEVFPSDVDGEVEAPATESGIELMEKYEKAFMGMREQFVV